MTDRNVVGRALAELLRDPSHTLRTGVLLVQPAALAQAREIANSLGTDWRDVVRTRLDRTEPGRRFLGLSRERLLEWLDELVAEEVPTGCVLVSNFDILIARLRDVDREFVWEFLLQSFRKRRSGLLLAMPNGSWHLFSRDQHARWSAVGRLVELA